MKGKKHSEKTKEKMRGPRDGFSKISSKELIEASMRFRWQKEVAKHFDCTNANISYLTKKYGIREEFGKNLKAQRLIR